MRLISVLKRKNAFTLAEVMIVIVIIGTIAAFAMPNYSRSVSRQYERRLLDDLRILYSAEQYYFSATGDYWPASGSGNQSLAAVNAALKVNLYPDVVHTCSYAPNPQCHASTARGGGFTLRADLDQSLSDSNPCCETGPCPTRPSC